MKVRLVGSLLLALCTSFGSVLAADLPQPPLYQTAAIDDWSGPYVGIALGGKMADITWTATRIGEFAFGRIDASSPRSFDPAGLRAGGYGGYSWQYQALVYGLEFDFAWVDASFNAAGLPGCAINCFRGGLPGTGADAAAVRMKWDASARARLGYLVSPDALLYATGGVAWQDIDASGTCANTLADPACLGAPQLAVKTQTDSVVRTGWTLGAGLEWKFAHSWILRTEYRFSDFGRWSDVFWAAQPSIAPGADTYRYELNLRTHIATFGLAYKFDTGAPTVASY